MTTAIIEVTIVSRLSGLHNRIESDSALNTEFHTVLIAKVFRIEKCIDYDKLGLMKRSSFVRCVGR